MLGTESFLRRHFMQWPQKREPQSTDAPSVLGTNLGTKSRTSSRDDTPHPTLGGSSGEPRTEGARSNKTGLIETPTPRLRLLRTRPSERPVT